MAANKTKGPKKSSRSTASTAPRPSRAAAGAQAIDDYLANVSPDRSGGMLVGGLFLREFVPEGTRWAHLDIAGPAFNEEGAHGYTPKGGTGVAVRTLVELAMNFEARPAGK